jgi:hypothetical protein
MGTIVNPGTVETNFMLRRDPNSKRVVNPPPPAFDSSDPALGCCTKQGAKLVILIVCTI